jgi:hypothetical protein
VVARFVLIGNGGLVSSSLIFATSFMKSCFLKIIYDKQLFYEQVGENFEKKYYTGEKLLNVKVLMSA